MRKEEEEKEGEVKEKGSEGQWEEGEKEGEVKEKGGEGQWEEGEKEEDGLVKGMEKEKRKVKVGNFLGKHSHLGPRDDEQAEWSKRPIIYNGTLQ